MKEWTAEQRQAAAQEVVERVYAEDIESGDSFDYGPYKRADVRKWLKGEGAVGGKHLVGMQCELNEARQIISALPALFRKLELLGVLTRNPNDSLMDEWLTRNTEPNTKAGEK